MDKISGMALGLLVGVGAGVAAGVLFAPRKGEETRQLIKQRAMESRAKMRQRMDQQKQMVKERASQAASASRELFAKGEEMATKAEQKTRGTPAGPQTQLPAA